MNTGYKESNRHMDLVASNISKCEVEHNPTVGENIDMKIAHLQREIARLEQSKIEMLPLMGMRIRDIRSAMEY